MYDQERLKQLIRERALKFGDFTLASGKKAKYYLDGKQITLHSRGLQLISSGLLELRGGTAAGALPPGAGDDIIDLGEGCEDGNLTNGDGCNDVCQLEIPDSGESIEITDAFTGSEDRYTRPGQGAGCGGGFGGSGSFPWRAWTWVNTSDVEQVVDIVAAWPADGFLFVYDGGFNPEEPTDGCLFGNDDDGGIRGSALRNIPVRAGGTITIVASTFSTAGFTGEFSITVTAR